MAEPVYINSEFIEANTNFVDLIDALRKGFSSNNMITPLRHHHHFPNDEMGADSTMLLMPSWQNGEDAGVKIVTVSPNNFKLNLPSIQGSYLYLNAVNGVVKAIFDAKSLTNKRTAAASALASSFLSNKASKTLLMVGTGALSTELIKAHCTVRSIEKVYVWGRNTAKAEKVKLLLQNEAFDVEVAESLENTVPKADIISTATLSENALIKGHWLKAGQHIDLVGSFKPNMREADDTTMKRAKLFADVKAMAIKESGDFSIPIENGTITENDIIGDLFDLCQNKIQLKANAKNITLFKSVGHAMEDLIAARYYFKKWENVNSL